MALALTAVFIIIGVTLYYCGIVFDDIIDVVVVLLFDDYSIVGCSTQQ